MSVSPVTIPPSLSVHEAHTLMHQRKIRHLPVLQDGCLVGIVSDRDIRLVLPSPATSLAVWEIPHSTELRGRACHRISKASGGEDLQIEEPVCCGPSLTVDGTWE
jgi:CBS domain-containing protein